MQISQETEIIRPIKANEVLKNAYKYIANNKKPMAVFVFFAIIIALFSAGFGGVASWGFWPVFVSFYGLESIFFRFYFNFSLRCGFDYLLYLLL